MKSYSKVISVIVAMLGALIIPFGYTLERRYVYFTYFLFIVGPLLIVNSMMIEIIKICKEHGKSAWTESKTLRKNSISILFLVSFSLILGYFILFYKSL